MIRCKCSHYDDSHADRGRGHCAMRDCDCSSFKIVSGLPEEPQISLKETSFVNVEGIARFLGKSIDKALALELPQGRSNGYHSINIPKGVLGETSKIEEEFKEFQDALSQNAVLMSLCELADLMGAIKAWLAKHHPTITILDLIHMSELTARAFRDGKRT